MDLMQHFQRLTEYPWLTWIVVSRSKRQRRAERARTSLSPLPSSSLHLRHHPPTYHQCDAGARRQGHGVASWVTPPMALCALGMVASALDVQRTLAPRAPSCGVVRLVGMLAARRFFWSCLYVSARFHLSRESEQCSVFLQTS